MAYNTQEGYYTVGNLGDYSTQPGYYTVGDLGEAEASFFKTWVWGPQGAWWNKAIFWTALGAAGYAGYRSWKKRRATALTY